jgi:succinate dehydrogenase (ubiquinone) iron-sulfur subunit
MSTKLVLNKDFNYRTILTTKKVKTRFMKLINTDLYLPVEHRTYISGKYNTESNMFSCKPRNRCILTGRARAVFKYFKLTRMMFKNLAVKGNLVGLRKASW